MARTSNQRQSKSSADKAGAAKAELLPPESDEQTAPGMKKVTVQRTERFIEPAASAASVPGAGATGPLAEEEEEWQDCPHCEGKFRAQAVAENGDYCPGCSRDDFGELKDAESPRQEISEAEILLNEIADDDEYKLRVERLVDYHLNGHTDSRAKKEFCTTLTPVTLDYLDRIQAMFGGGNFWFTMYRKGSPGIVKAWHKSIANRAQPTAEETAPQTTAPAQSIAPQVDRLRVAVEKAVATRIERILDDPPAPPAALPAAPVDEQAIVAQAIMARPEVIESVIRRVTDKLGNEGEPWYAPLVRAGIENLPLIISTIQTIATAGPPNGSALPPHAADGSPQTAGQNGHAETPPQGDWRGDNASPAGTTPAEDQTPPPTYTAAQIAFLKLIRRVAADMDDSTDARDESGEPLDVCDPGIAVAGTLRLIQNFPEYRPQINQVLLAPPAMLVAFVAEQCQDFSLVRNAGSAVFAVEYQKALREAIQMQEPEAGSQEPDGRPQTAGTEPDTQAQPSDAEASRQ